MKSETSFVQTVRGAISPDQLGRTIMHEHLFCTGVEAYFAENPAAPAVNDGPLSADNRWWVGQNWNSNADNLLMDSHDEAVYELGLFSEAGGQSVVEVTIEGILLPDQPQRLKRLSEATGVNIIMGTGWYVRASLGERLEEVEALTEEQMADKLVRDVSEGMNGTDIKAGMIGEVGVSVPFYDVERKVVKAAIVAHRRTGAPVEIHPGMNDDILLEIVELAVSGGADTSKVILCHQDNFGYTRETRLAALQAGCLLEFDTFGSTTWQDTATLGAPAGLPQPSDSVRLDDLEYFVEQGYIDQLLVSQDVFFKTLRATYGGPGYSHVLRNMVPYMRARGWRDADIDRLLIDNPRRALTFGSPA